MEGMTDAGETMQNLMYLINLRLQRSKMGLRLPFDLGIRKNKMDVPGVSLTHILVFAVYHGLISSLSHSLVLLT